jgi:D-3-phosphoglycerate dehydrogenase
MQVSIADKQQQAMAVISVSQPVSAEIIAVLNDIPAIRQLIQIQL